MTDEPKTFEEDLEVVVRALNTLLSKEAKEAFKRLFERSSEGMPILDFEQIP